MGMEESKVELTSKIILVCAVLHYWHPSVSGDNGVCTYITFHITWR